jgi:hypothetical protein
MSAGLSILVDRSLTPQITSNDILFEGRAQFITLKLSDNGKLTIVNVYVVHTSNERTSMWKRLSESSFNTAHIIIGGDFNHLKETNRRGKVGERFILRRKATSWHHMMLQYGLVNAWKLDSFRKMSKKEYTFDNGKFGVRSAISRIDKFLVS